MKKTYLLFAVLFILSVSSFTLIKYLNWKIADGYSIKFTSKHPSGKFKSLKGDIQFDEKNLNASKFNVSIESDSITTGDKTRDRHALSEDWFDVKKYPLIKFTSTSIIKTSTGYSTTGILDLHGVQKEITLPFIFENNVFSGKFSINRLDYRVGSRKGFGSLVPNKINLEISVPVTKE